MALYVYVPVILAAALLDERLKPMQIGGILVAGAAVVLLSASWGSSKRGRKSDARGPEEVDVADSECPHQQLLPAVLHVGEAPLPPLIQVTDAGGAGSASGFRFGESRA